MRWGYKGLQDIDEILNCLVEKKREEAVAGVVRCCSSQGGCKERSYIKEGKIYIRGKEQRYSQPNQDVEE